MLFCFNNECGHCQSKCNSHSIRLLPQQYSAATFIFTSVAFMSALTNFKGMTKNHWWFLSIIYKIFLFIFIWKWILIWMWTLSPFFWEAAIFAFSSSVLWSNSQLLESSHGISIFKCDYLKAKIWQFYRYQSDLHSCFAEKLTCMRSQI